MAQRSAYGGQAVIEGVMIRGKERVATACRLTDGSIIVRHDEADGLLQRYAWLRLAFLRGTPALIDSIRLGYRTLMWSADQVMEAESQPKPTGFQYFISILAALAIGIGGFVLFPTAAVNWIFPGFKHAGAEGATLWAQLLPTTSAILPNILEGVIRLVLLTIYIWGISFNKEIKRVFAYHGAEHKVVNAYERGVAMTVAAVKPFSRIHPRCGTSFLFLTFIVGILIHALIGWPDHLGLRMASRLALLPIVAGVAYELIRLSGRFVNSRLMMALVSPGLLLQRITTAEPEDDQIEVALKAMRTVLEDEGVLEPEEVAPAPELPASGSVAPA